MRTITPLALLCAALSSGCIVGTMGRDQDRIRGAILDLYTNQVMDNLVRASQGLPIVQVDYTNATGTVGFSQTASFSDMQAVTDSTTTAIPALTQSIARSIVTTISGSLGASHSNQVAITGTPVTTANEVYDAYLEFLSIPGSLVVTCEPPPACAAHMCKQCNGRYYWVPVDYRGDFFKLALLTTVRRGTALLPDDRSYAVKLQKLDHELKNQSKHGVKLAIQIDKSIPNDDGYVTYMLSASDKTPVESPVTRYEPEDLPPDKPAPAQTKIIVIGFVDDLPDVKNGQTAGAKSAQFLAALKQQTQISANVFLRHYQAGPPTIDDLLQRSNFLLQQIQFNQLRSTPP